MLSRILNCYGITHEQCLVEPLVSGLINKTWKITHGHKAFILQRINDHVFKMPQKIADNLRLLDEYLKANSPDYLFVCPIQNLESKEMTYDSEFGYFRLFPFIQGSHTINVVSSADQAYEAALQFGKFTKHLSGFNASKLHTTIPNFHNLSLRYSQYRDSLAHGNKSRMHQAEKLIHDLEQHKSILDTFEKLQRNDQVKKRVMHHDTKISNVLFNDAGKGIAIIDLDTVMPGYFISDVGDMMRTYLSPANEEEKDFSRIEIRDDFFKAIVNGYISSMENELTEVEQRLILYSGQFIIFMQAIRFLADYFNDDTYYGVSYEENNLVRATNQLTLLKKLEEKKIELENYIKEELKTHSHFFFGKHSK
ncbi:MAG: aminoglycoside phosphotransferase family protein [Cyclobacteriaceae bacterium]|nr:aminoglycoside phosphotransferase family protein [Cyclobacteriaceae bacterium]